MKKLLLTTTLIYIFPIVFPTFSFAQGMMGQFNNPSLSSQSSTAQDEAEGKAVFDKLQSKQIDCKSLTNDDFDVLGDYYMGMRMGGSHETMNNMMSQMMGEEGERQMHISLGKRLSGCDPSFPIPTQGTKFLSMIGENNENNRIGQEGGWNMMGNNFNGMMAGWGIFGSLTWLLVIVFLVLGIIYFGKQITKKERK